MADPRADEILAFWFGGSPADRRRWFGKDAAFDAEIRAKFAADVERAAAGELAAWANDPRGALALVILLDQFPRNLHRGSPAAFAHDATALAVARAAMTLGHDAALPPVERAFLYMPLMHAEDREVQRDCAAAFHRLADDAAAAGASADDTGYLRMAADYADQHAAIVERFGRFPHRNAVLGRASTAEELAFLTEPGSSF
jgi:uncharacterized protein (DUF924 family)